MQSPLRSSVGVTATTGVELKHKSTYSGDIKLSKGLFSPTLKAKSEDVEHAETIYSSVTSQVSTPKRTSSGSFRNNYEVYEKSSAHPNSSETPQSPSEDVRVAAHDNVQQTVTNTGSNSKVDDTTASSADEDYSGVFNPYQFISGLPPLESIERNKVALPPSTDASKPTLVLDLDETLVHCTVEAIPNPDLTFPVNFNGVLYIVYVRKRPYLDYFLEAVSRSFEVVVFTASQKVYADVLLDLLDPEKKYVKHRLFRESCVCVQGNYLKDLHVCGREYHKTALVDNSPHAYGYQIENGIPIESWFDDDNDTELLKLVGFLRKAFAASDVRTVIREHFKTHDLINRAKGGLFVDLSVVPPF